MEINHPGMTKMFFDDAVRRGFELGMTVKRHPNAGNICLVKSSTKPMTYFVTRSTCSCEGHKHYGRCIHRAMAIAYADVFGFDTTETADIAVSATG